MAKTWEEIDEILETYKETFGEIFPTMAVGFRTLEELDEKVKECIRTGKPATELFVTYRDSDVLY